MISNYLKIGLRSLWNKKAFSSINICGLAIGLATCMLILLFVQHELSYDRFNQNAGRIFRVTLHGRIGGNDINIAGASAPAGPALLRDYPGVEAYTRLSSNGTFLVKNGEKRFLEERVIFTDSNFFNFFSIPLLKGDANNVLKEPKTLVLTRSMALKYFGNQDPIGKSLDMGNSGAFRVTGVCEDVPSNSHFHYNFFGSMKSVTLGDKWLSSGAHTYILLHKGYPVEKLSAQMPQMVRKYIGPEIQEFLGMSYDEYLRKGDKFGLGLQALTDIHLTSNLENELEGNSNIKYIYIFTAIAAFILLIACINFMNLSTAGSAGRAKEVGVRKVMGSVRQQLMAQFLTESVLVTFFALLVALVLVVLLLPGFNDLAGKRFDLQSILNARMIGYAVAGCLIVGFLAGSYPAFFLSAFRPVAVLKGSIQAGVKSGWLRNTLVTIQFVVSIVMIIGTMIVYQQLRFIQNKNVGFDKEQVLILHDTHLLGDKARTFKEQVGNLSAVSSVTLAGYLPAGNSNNGTDGFLPENAENNITPYRFTTYQVDQDYLRTLGIGLVNGRNFSKSFGGDSASILINEAAVKQFGWKDPIGKRIRTIGNGTPESKRFYTVVGVTKDFHFRSMHERIAPLVMFYGGDQYQMAVKIKTNDIPGVLKALEKTWKATTDNPFGYSFLNERFDNMYESEQRVGKLFGIFAGLAVVIACLGLFGLAAFTTIQRTKEIGVRKVLGASVLSIVSLLSRDFVKLVGIAILIASPLAWYGMNEWLSDFAYKVSIEWWVFLVAGVLAVSVALLTVSFQSIKAALVNPVKSLKRE
ncbi:ABC transporter permease [Dyadobacter jiangsuensis]|uniref:Putative ABC transport system permease protein n=1 Tax=Dyadobacter jiangsuensis TaxID=1591085 RepID=A0A2P8G4A9_9BACT|nr:ABC transporter permease [Dyadobacter jiangsuensis]PSL28725.1 putative ABC transport system permease protein [Dyadobacter jiangsuensis]